MNKPLCFKSAMRSACRTRSLWSSRGVLQPFWCNCQPGAEKPRNAPQMSGTQVTGLVSCSRIFHMFVSLSAPRMPSSWLSLPLPLATASCALSCSSSFVSFCARTCQLCGRRAVFPATLTKPCKQVLRSCGSRHKMAAHVPGWQPGQRLCRATPLFCDATGVLAAAGTADPSTPIRCIASSICKTIIKLISSLITESYSRQSTAVTLLGR